MRAAIVWPASVCLAPATLFILDNFGLTALFVIGLVGAFVAGYAFDKATIRKEGP